MEFTRRFRTVAALAATLTGYGALVGSHVAVVGGAAASGWLVARQWAFRRDLARVREDLSVEQSLAPGRVSVDGRTDLSVSVAAPTTPVSLTVTATPPPAADGNGPTVDLDFDPSTTTTETASTTTTETASTTTTVRWPVAGSYAFDPPTVAVSGPTGLFRERLSLGTTPTVTVESPAPTDIHVGTGGDPVTGTAGEHPGGESVGGLDPSELREYAPSDPARLIDWSATARTGTPHVREFEGDTSQRTVLVVDHRGSLAAGPPGRRALDYLREVGLGFLDSARTLDDPLGYYAVGEDGLTARFDLGRTDDHAARVQRHLEALAPTETNDPSRSRRRRSSPSDPATARRAATRLADDDSPFARTLGPFFEDSRTYVRRFADDPLFGAVETAIDRTRGDLRLVVLTDDRTRRGLKEAVELAARRDHRPLVFLAPTALFDPDDRTDFEATYNRYVDFEEFRRELARVRGAMAFEVAPGNRLESLLATRRRRRANATGSVPATGGDR